MNRKYATASLLADALSLGPHWVYDQAQIAAAYPSGINGFSDPLSPYHPHRKAGQHTHYGDQTLLLQSSITHAEGYQSAQWKSDWLAGMGDYDGYVDGASKATLATQGEQPSESSDLAGASRIGPILDLQLPLDQAIAAARSQTQLTHGSPEVSDAAEFFTRAAYLLEDGLEIGEALEKAASEGSYKTLPAAEALESAKQLQNRDFKGAAQELGLGCSIPGAFAVTLYFALRPSKSFLASISDNALAGGDSSARGMLLAILLAAKLSPEDSETIKDLSEKLSLA
ncbi:MAG: ADP-ribosylglycohydrolase family protein [Verrucomicrobiota bacterium]